MSRAWQEELETTGRFFCVPKGFSMWPMIYSKRDIVEVRRLEGEAKRYDLVLYKKEGTEQGVLHRVLHVREKDYVIAGDNTWWKEYIAKERVVGIATRFYRKGKWYEVTNRGYRLYAHLMADLFFLRSPLQRCRDKARAELGKLRKGK